jgi:lysophospholipase L1-like esterase
VGALVSGAESGSTDGVTRTGRSSLRAVAVAAVVLVGLVATTTGASATAPTKHRSVVLIGDSVMAALGAGYTDAATKVIGAAGWNVVIDARVNRTTAQGADVARARRPQETDSVVIMLGHNDGATPSVFTRRATAVLDQLKRVPHVYWLTMREPRYGRANQVLQALTTRYSNVRLIDWAHQIKPGWTATDGLHLNGAGATGMAKLILVSLR